MLIKVLSLLLICLMINLTLANVAVAGDSDSDKAAKLEAKAAKRNAKKEAKLAKRAAKREAKIAKKALKVQNAILKLGIGRDSVVQLKLRDKTKIKGYISEIGENNFTVIDESGTPRVVDYRSPKQVRGNNLHAGVWVAIGVGIALVTIIVILNIALRDS